MTNASGDAASARLAALRAAGAWRLDPARFAWMESLCRRLEAQPPAVRQRLQPRLEGALDDYAARWAEAQQSARDAAARAAARHPPLAREARRLLALGDVRAVQRLALRAPAAPTASPLAALNAYIRDARSEPEGAATARPELGSVRRFRQAWSRNRAQERVDQVVARRPAQAGPLNSHRLLLQALDRMRELSPDYLRRFLSQVESLQWLDQARAAKPPASPRRPPAKR